MTIEEALTKATAGGYHIYGSDGMDTYYEGASNAYSAWTRKDNASTFVIAVEETFLDPAFWQALGKAVGWSEETEAAVRYRVTEPASIGNTKPLFSAPFPPTACAHPVPPSRPPAGACAWARPTCPAPHSLERAPRPGVPWARCATGSPPPAAPERQQQASRPAVCGRAGCWLRVTGSRPPHAGSAARDCFKRYGKRFATPGQAAPTSRIRDRRPWPPSLPQIMKEGYSTRFAVLPN